jgi:hypothetical protein
MGRSPGVALIAALAALVLPVTAAAGSLDTWSRFTLRHTAGVGLQDAEFQGTDVAALWAEPGHELWFRTSTNAGGSFAARQKIPGETREGATDICGDDLYVAYAHKVAATWGIRAGTRKVDGAGFASSAVSLGEDRTRDPDVACAGGRLFVSWLEHSAGHFRVRVANALRSDRVFADPPMLFGNTQPIFGKPVVAGVADRAYMVSQSSAGFATGPVLFNRWSVGAAPQAPVAFLGSTTLAQHGGFPIIAARGTTVVVAWTDGSTGIAKLGIRVSHDRGAPGARRASRSSGRTSSPCRRVLRSAATRSSWRTPSSGSSAVATSGRCPRGRISRPGATSIWAPSATTSSSGS